MMAWILCFKARNQKDIGCIANFAHPFALLSAVGGGDEAGLTTNQMRMILLSSTRKNGYCYSVHALEAPGSSADLNGPENNAPGPSRRDGVRSRGKPVTAVKA